MKTTYLVESTPNQVTLRVRFTEYSDAEDYYDNCAERACLYAIIQSREAGQAPYVRLIKQKKQKTKTKDKRKL